jgi:glucose-1-phosphate thymidylyltransferase
MGLVPVRGITARVKSGRNPSNIGRSSTEMKVVIPLAGLGKRLRPHTLTKPKPLVKVAGKPVLAYILDQLKCLDIDEIIFITGYLGEQIKDYVTANYTFATRFIEQKEMLGQAHAISLAKDYLEGPVLIVFVDTIFEADLSNLDKLEADGVLYVKEVADPARFGVAVTDKDGYVTRLVEKPKEPVSNLAVIGVYYFKDSKWLIHAVDKLMQENIQTQGEYYLADAIQLMINEGARLLAETVDVWQDCGKVETLLDTNRFLLEKNGGETPAEMVNSIIIQPVHIAESVRLENSIVGPYVSISEYSTVRNCIIRDSIINENSEIDSAILCGSVIGTDASVKGVCNSLNVGDSSEIRFSGDSD